MASNTPSRQLPMPDGPAPDGAEAWLLVFKQRLANWQDATALAISTLQNQVSTLQAEVEALKAKLP